MTKSAADQVISDPDNHYPYDRERAEKAGISSESAKASEAVVKAQEAYLRDPSEKNLKARNAAEARAQEVSRARRESGAAPPSTGPGDAHVSFDGKGA
jgi:hypothetical protein